MPRPKPTTAARPPIRGPLTWAKVERSLAHNLRDTPPWRGGKASEK